MKNNIFYYLVAIALVSVILFLSEFNHGIPKNAVIPVNSWHMEQGDGEGKMYSVPFYITGDSPSEFSVKTYVMTTKFENLEPPDKPVLILPYTFANGIKVEINGIYIGSVGDLHSGRTGRWNTSHCFSIPRELLHPNTEITLTLFGLYEIGIIRQPYIAEISTESLRPLLLYGFDMLMIPGIIGGLLVLAVIFFLSSIIIDGRNKPRILLSIALVGLAVYLLDYTYIPMLPFEYYIFKKITLTGLYIALLFSIPGFFGYLQQPINLFAKLMMILPLITIFILLLIPTNIFEVRTVYKYANLFVFPYIILMYWALPVKGEMNRRILVLHGGLIILLLLALRDIVSILMNHGSIILTHYGVLFFLLTLTYAFIDEMFEYYTKLIRTKRWADTVYADSMQDPLTGALNRKVFEVLKQINPEKFSMIMLDIDDFKSVNDSYGHQAGDEVLKRIVTTVMHNIRKTDYIVRLGGDEFAVILFNCNLEEALQTAELLHEKLSEEEMDFNGSQVKISCSMGVGTVESAQRLFKRLSEIDSYMYQAKREGKNRIVSPVTAPSGTP